MISKIGAIMKKLIYACLIMMVFTFAFTGCTSEDKTSTGTKIRNSEIDPLLDPRDNNAPLVYPYRRTGYEPNYLNAEGIVLSYSDRNISWSWLGLLGLFGLFGLTGGSRRRSL
jgi:hypothetical protein